MHYCCVFGCFNKQENEEYVGSFHCFPSDKKLRKQWNHAIYRQAFKGGSGSRVCSDHFRDDDFHVSPAMAKRLSYKLQKFTLHKGVVPSQKLRGDKDYSTKKNGSLAITKRTNLETINSTQVQCHPNEWVMASKQQQVVPVVQPQVATQDVNATAPLTQCAVGIQVTTSPNKVTHEVGVTCALILPKSCPKPDTKHQGTQYKPSAWASRSRGTQTRPVMVDKSVSCNIPKPRIKPDEDFLPDEKDDEEDEPMSEDDSDSDWEPDEEDEEMAEESESDADSDIDESDDDLEEDDDRKFIIYGSCLRSLLSVCWLCGEACRVLVKVKRGTGYTFESICTNHHSRTWATQPMKGRMSAGNLSLAASIFFSGSNIVKSLNLFRFAKIPVFSEKTFRSIQKLYLIPSVHNIWDSQRSENFNAIRAKGGKVTVGGDGRCDSPGFSAKYGTYSLMDSETNKIISCHLTQCSQTGTSAGMEKAGLIKCMTELAENDIEIDTLITDRHPSIRKHIREQHPGIIHYFDIWHVCKGVKRKLLTQGKKKGFDLLTKWTPSISNHLYWAAASSGGDGELAQAKWASVQNHVCDIHTGHSPMFPECQHGPIGPRNWIKKGSVVHKALIKIVSNSYIMKDVASLSPKEQTSALEGFHRVVCLFAPKSYHFPYCGMEARIILSVLHFNENIGRSQKCLANGDLQWKVSYPKHKKGEGVLRPSKTPCTYEYVFQLMAEADRLRDEYPTYEAAKVLVREAPPPLTATMDLVPKAHLLEKYKSRFQ